MTGQSPINPLAIGLLAIIVSKFGLSVSRKKAGFGARFTSKELQRLLVE